MSALLPGTPILADRFAILVAWIREREAIRERKEGGAPWPWTSNALLRDYRWCNVRRADDRVSRDLLRRWYRPDADSPTQLVAATLGRLVNWTDALLEVSAGGYFDMGQLDSAERVLAARAARAQKVFTGAYIVPGVPGIAKTQSVCATTRTVAANAAAIFTSSMQGTWSNLTKIDGLGSFLAGQIVADLALLPLGARWPDAKNWAPVGPGSARGWNRLTGRPLDRRVSQDEFDAALPLLLAQLERAIPEIWTARGMIAMDGQNCCCEIDKTFRLMNGEGTVRAKYAPPATAALF